MDRLLSLSKAARMAGIGRSHLQRMVQAGEISTFEGSIRLTELKSAFPGLDPDASAVIERTRRIQKNAGLKRLNTRDPERLQAQVHRLQLELEQTQQDLQGYRELAEETSERLHALEAQCDKREKTLLHTMLGWYMHQLHLRKDR